ncbi:MAG: PspC domain-containing protein [Pseudomonadales bacterium]
MNRSISQRLRQRFFLDRRNGWIAGVCAGVARSFNTDPAFLRVGFVLVGLFAPKIAIGAYLIAWIVLERRDI